ncbi:hypothetical protein GCM10009555_031060 [Acrocarpospora macrocephala]|uniref:DUF5753 domain-containing protein n=2 Tax=Acrocarpospora macrocephala TaxID=150177 RepID=A0A5M3WSR8_9ACTN|nr:hypothetical protein Amac_060340 [Acrocarpospora macrocephala]
MIDQLQHFIEVAEEENNKIIIQVILASARVCARFNAPFVLAAFDGGEVAYLGNALRSDVVEDAEDLVRLRRLFDVYRAEALRQDESITFIARVVEEWKNQL